MNLRQYAQDFIVLNPTLLLDEESVLKCFVEATRKYQAWGGLSAEEWLHTEPTHYTDRMPDYKPIEVNEDTEITPSEYGVIVTLARLYVERENALMQEASRLAGHEPYGRNTSEIEADIAAFERDSLGMYAFIEKALSV